MTNATKILDINPNRDTKFVESFDSRIAYNLEQVKEYLRLAKTKNLAFDIETTGLDPRGKDSLIGFSISCDPYSAVYVPIRHVVGNNMEVEDAMNLLRVLFKNFRVLVYNSSFDLMFMKYLGIDISKVDFIDVMLYFYLYDTDFKFNSLKNATRYFLGRDAPFYKDVLGKKIDLSYLDAEDVKFYVNNDAANTYALYVVFTQLFDQYKKELYSFRDVDFIVKLDQLLAKTMLHYLDVELDVDDEYTNEFLIYLDNKIESLEKDIVRLNNNTTFKFNSRQELSKVLAFHGVNTGEKTEKLGLMKTTDRLLQKVDHPLAKAVVFRNSLVKMRSAYIAKIGKLGTKMRVNYSQTRAPTGRLISGSSSKNPFYANLNIQNLSKPGVAYYATREKADGDVVGNKDGMYEIEGHIFQHVASKREDSSLRYVEGYEFSFEKFNIRRVLVVPNRKDWYMVSVDYDAEELKLAAIASKEKVWLSAYLNNEDIHKNTAVALFGKEEYNNSKRKIAKIANFSLLYGGSAKTFSVISGLGQEESELVHKKFWGSLGGLRSWRDREVAFAKRSGGMCKSLLGRPRKLGQYLNSSEFGLRAFGERSVISHQIQGTAADVMRIALVRLHDTVFMNEGIVNEDVKFVATIHDEIVFCVRKDLLSEYLSKVIEGMEIQMKGWPLKLTVSFSIGYSYGELFPHKYVDERIVPNYE